MGIEIEAVGTTQANESVEVTSKASNTVTAIRFQEGEEVDAAPCSSRWTHPNASRTRRGQASLARSKSQYDRSRDLQSRQALSLGGSRASRGIVESRRSTRRRRSSSARRHRDPRIVQRPNRFRHVSVGSFVSPGTAITTLDDTSIIKLDFTVPETYLFVLRRGLPVTAIAAGLPDRTFTGVVTNMDSRVDPVTRSVIVRAELDNPDGVLRQGMFMTVALQGEVTPTLLVPEEALVRNAVTRTCSSYTTTSSNAARCAPANAARLRRDRGRRARARARRRRRHAARPRRQRRAGNSRRRELTHADLGAFGRRPVFATVFSMLLVIFGLVSLQRLSVREYPDIDRPTSPSRRPIAAHRPRSSRRRSRRSSRTPSPASKASSRSSPTARTSARRSASSSTSTATSTPPPTTSATGSPASSAACRPRPIRRRSSKPTRTPTPS